MRGRRGAWILTGLIVTVAVPLIVAADSYYDGDRNPGFAIVMALALSLARKIEFNFEVRDHGMATDPSQLLLVVALATLSPGEIALAYAASSLVVLWSTRRSGAWMKLAFNVSTQALSAGVLCSIYLLISGPRGEQHLVAGSFAAVLSSSIVELLLITAVIRISAGPGSTPRLAMPTALGLTSATANTCLGIIAWHLYTHDWALLGLLALPSALAYVGYRRHSRLSAQHQQLMRLYQYTGELAGAPELQDMLTSTLKEAVEATNAHRAEVMLVDPDGSVHLAFGFTLHDGTTIIDADPTSPSPALGAVTGTRGSLLGTDGRWAAAPLSVGATVLGVLTVHDRLGSNARFSTDDLSLLTTIADHAAMSVENARLVDELRRESIEREHQAMHDSLTGLGNRRLLYRELHEAISDARSTTTTLSVLLVDLNGFKDVNDLLGHGAGDEALRIVADRLRLQCADTVCLARLGGDEFAVVVQGGPDDAYLLGDSIRRSMEEPLQLDGLPITVGASVGIAFYPAHATEVSALLKRADQALYVAKRHPELPVQAFDGTSDRSTARRVTLATDLREALDARQLEVYFQPQAELAGGRLMGAEALLRWHHPRLGPVPPDEFIAIGEHIGLIGRITHFVLDTSVAQAAAWAQAGHRLVMSVNLSTRNLLDPSLPVEVASVLQRHGLPADRLTLEITETQLLSEPERAIPTLIALGKLGVGLSIDDFGTGYSSLAYLKRLPVTELKVDRSFVLDLPTDVDDQAIVRTVIQLAANLGLEVVAEGIEDQVTWDLLAAMGCQRGQGYFLARPLPAAQFTEWLVTRSGRGIGLSN